ncbi:MAG TPA: MFS transporter [Thermoleophilaceae bacterium]
MLTRLTGRSNSGLLVAGIVLIAFCLRPAITSVGPLTDEIRAGLHLSSAGVGLITTLPLLAFGAVSPFAARIGLRLGIERTLGLALALIAAGLIVRSVSGVGIVYLTTTLVGAGIAACNVLLPGLVKEEFQERSGAMTSVYVTAMVGMAGVAGATAVPLANSGLGWRGALGFWAVPAVIAFLVWLPRTRERHVPEGAREHVPLPWRSPLAWQITIFMGLQSLVFFGLVAWLPDLLRDAGVGASASGVMVGVMQLGGLVSTIGVPVLAVRRPTQYWLVLVTTAICLAGVLGLLIAPRQLAAAWAIMVGLSTGAFLSLGLTFFVVRARDTAHTAALSGMAQSGGYTLAAASPAGIGALHDLAGGWTLPLWTLVGVTLLTGLFGLGAARDRVVAD